MFDFFSGHIFQVNGKLQVLYFAYTLTAKDKLWTLETK